MEIKEIVDINQLKHYERNPRIVKKTDIERLKKQITRLGVYKPLLIDQNNVVLGGNQRLHALKALGHKEVWVSRVEPKTEAERLEYVISDNDAIGVTDEQLLAELITEHGQFDLEIYKYLEDSGKTIQELLNKFGPDVVEDEPPAVEEEAISKLGDVYQLGKHRLMCGDATSKEDVEKLMDGKKADMVFTDPPYGMNLDADFSKLPNNKTFQREKGIKAGKKYKDVIGDNDDFTPNLITCIFDNFDYCKEIFVWGGDYYPELLKGYKTGNFIVWDKKSNDGMENNNFDKTLSSNFELCWSKQRHKRDIVRTLWVSAFGTEQEFDHKRYHPTQKPTKLSRWFVEKYSDNNQVIVDLFGGSGSTLIACEQTNRICYMMEIDPGYCDVIRKRYAKFINKEDEWQKITPLINR